MEDRGEPTVKVCSKCRRLLPRDAFAANRAMRDGMQGHCRACQAAHYRRRRAAEGKVVRERVDIPDGHKFCPGCAAVKPLAEWSRNRAGKDGYHSYCKACKARMSKISYFKQKYGISEAELDSLLAQYPICPICRINEPKHVDHDHVSGRVRGILCFTCNAALGQLRDDPEIIRRAADYVEGATMLKGVA